MKKLLTTLAVAALFGVLGVTLARPYHNHDIDAAESQAQDQQASDPIACNAQPDQQQLACETRNCYVMPDQDRFPRD